MKRLFLTLIVAFLAGLMGAYVSSKFQPKSQILPSGSAAKESAYDRVMRTKTLRCGYVVDPPHVIRDPATGIMSGSIVDIMNEAGRVLEIKIEWPEEVGWGTQVEALRSGRVDAICVDDWMNPTEGRYLSYTMPLYFAGVGVFVRVDDFRFDHKLESINDASVTIATADGEMSSIIARQDYPKAKTLSLPNLNDVAQNLINVGSGKADVTFIDTMAAQRYSQNNPGKVRNLVQDRPLRSFPATIAIPQGDVALKGMLDSAFVQLLYGGFVNKILDKYGMVSSVVYRVALPYQIPEASKTLP